MRKPTLEEIRRLRVLDVILTYERFDKKEKKRFQSDIVPQKEIGRLLNWYYIPHQDKDPMDPKNWPVTPLMISKTLKGLEEDGLITKEPLLTPGKGPAQNMITIKKDYETLYKLLKEYYKPPFNPRFQGIMGINLINSHYVTELVNMDLMNKINEDLELCLTLEEKEAALKILKISPYALFSTLETVEDYKEEYIAYFENMGHLLKNSFFLTLLNSVGQDFNYNQLFTKVPIEYEIKVKFKDQVWDLEDPSLMKNAENLEEVLTIDNNSLKITIPSLPANGVMKINFMYPPFKTGKNNPEKLSKSSYRLLYLDDEYEDF